MGPSHVDSLFEENLIDASRPRIDNVFVYNEIDYICDRGLYLQCYCVWTLP